MLPRPPAVWLGAVSALTALDLWCNRGEPNGDTLSECVRDWFAVDTPQGRIIFSAALAAGACWFHGHICNT